MAKTRKSKKILSAIAAYAVLIVCSGCFGYFGAEFIDTQLGGERFFLHIGLAFIGVILAYIVQIILHEGGHLVFGLMSGYEFVSFNVLGLIWQKGPDGKLRLGRMQIAGAGGQCLMAPPQYNDGHFPFTLYNLGGVLMNLISALICALVMALVPAGWLTILLGTQVFVAVFFGLLNGLPLPVAAIQNDGKNLLCIRRDATARWAFWVQMSIAAELARGVRIKAMPDEWFTPMPEDKLDNPIISSIPVMNTSRLMDKLDLAGAEEAIRALLSREKGVLPLHRMIMSCDGAVCELIAGRPADLTESLSSKENQQLMKAMKTNPSILRTEYALALLKDRDTDKAEKCLATFDTAAKNHPHPQEIEGEREILAAIQRAANRS